VTATVNEIVASTSTAVHQGDPVVTTVADGVLAADGGWKPPKTP
jgi:hypothetical protein